MLAVILGLIVAPAFTARAWVIGTGPAAAVCGLIAAAALLMAVVLAALVMEGRAAVMDRVELREPGSEHPTQLGYYGGPVDGRCTRVRRFTEDEVSMIDTTARAMTEYSVTRYGVHPDKSVCWIILTHTPSADRGKL